MITDARLTVDEVNQILSDFGWNYSEAALVLNLSYATVSRMARGLMPVPVNLAPRLRALHQALMDVRLSKPG